MAKKHIILAIIINVNLNLRSVCFIGYSRGYISPLIWLVIVLALYIPTAMFEFHIISQWYMRLLRVQVQLKTTDETTNEVIK